MKTIVLHVEGMMCAHCEHRIQTALASLDGIKQIKADAAGSQVTCAYDETKITPEAIKETIEDVGYEVK